MHKHCGGEKKVGEEKKKRKQKKARIHSVWLVELYVLVEYAGLFSIIVKRASKPASRSITVKTEI